ncbi:hypothetical protein HK102_000440 [Quaeritorhiza haematococci]|nr:hypothetical protein HK102_000440 [Quaeritorhiza haematococci]
MFVSQNRRWACFLLALLAVSTSVHAIPTFFNASDFGADSSSTNDSDNTPKAPEGPDGAATLNSIQIVSASGLIMSISNMSSNDKVKGDEDGGSDKGDSDVKKKIAEQLKSDKKGPYPSKLVAVAPGCIKGCQSKLADYLRAFKQQHYGPFGKWKSPGVDFEKLDEAISDASDASSACVSACITAGGYGLVCTPLTRKWP